MKPHLIFLPWYVGMGHERPCFLVSVARISCGTQHPQHHSTKKCGAASSDRERDILPSYASKRRLADYTPVRCFWSPWVYRVLKERERERERERESERDREKQQREREGERERERARARDRERERERARESEPAQWMNWEPHEYTGVVHAWLGGGWFPGNPEGSTWWLSQTDSVLLAFGRPFLYGGEVTSAGRKEEREREREQRESRERAERERKRESREREKAEREREGARESKRERGRERNAIHKQHYKHPCADWSTPPPHPQLPRPYSRAPVYPYNPKPLNSKP